MVKQERAARTRETLVRAAAEVFAEEGFVTASIASIAKRAGVSAGGLHFHFGSKLLLAEAVEGRAADAVHRITSGRRREAGRDALQLMVDSTHDLAALLAQDAVVRAGFGLCADLARNSVADLRGQWRKWIEDAFEAAARENRLAEGVEPVRAAHAVVAATVGFEVLGAAEPGWVSRAVVTDFWELLLPRLAAPEALARLTAGGGGTSPYACGP
ncbi:ScbR family autoregulator-binding transcription factor [Streptomyces sp. NPDC091268]|uniref:ScbR family autoregulator-binding transcription factor n=1 Tax=Streptomyces sp. NPDC091268 TaxID=3365979 RepID=UPI00381F620C